MNDNLILLVCYILKDYSYREVVLSIEHGLNNFFDWKYWNEPDIKKQYLEMLGYDEKYNNIETIIKVTEINDIIHIKKNK